MPDPKPTFNLIQVNLTLDKIWGDTINTADTRTSMEQIEYDYIVGLSKIDGYLESVTDFKILPKDVIDELWDKYAQKYKFANNHEIKFRSKR